jgi:hypothetical protein
MINQQISAAIQPCKDLESAVKHRKGIYGY